MECTVTRYKGVFFFSGSFGIEMFGDSFQAQGWTYQRSCQILHVWPYFFKEKSQSPIYTHFAAGAYKFQFWSSSLEKPHAEKFNQIPKHSPIEWRGEVEVDHVFLPLNAFPLFLRGWEPPSLQPTFPWLPGELRRGESCDESHSTRPQLVSTWNQPLIWDRPGAPSYVTILRDG